MSTYCTLLLFVVLIATIRGDPSVVTSLCPPRDEVAASDVGRHCLAACTSNIDCSGTTKCVCDHQCGMTCVDLETQCGNPPLIRYMESYQVMRPNGATNQLAPFPPFYYNDFAAYKCQPGFKLTNHNGVIHMCHSRKGWTIGSIACVPDCEDRNHTQVNSEDLNCGNPCFNDGECLESQRCVCDGSCGASCVDNDVSCGDAPPCGDCTIVYSGEGLGKVAHYTCSEGFYIATGSESRKCTGGGSYDGVLPVCKRVTCGDPTVGILQTGGEVTGGQAETYYVGDYVTFSCPASDNLVGSSNVTCTSDGRWTGITPVCDSKDATNRCPNPGIPVNGRVVSGNFSVGDVIEFECEVGYVMWGEARQECLDMLQWSDGGSPLCLDPDLPALDRLFAEEIVKNTDVSFDEQTNQTCHKEDYSSEVYYVIDFSGGDDVLMMSLETVRGLLSVLSQSISPPGRILFVAYAEKLVVLQEINLRSSSVHQAILYVDHVIRDRVRIRRLIGSRNFLGKALISLEGIVNSSFSSFAAVRNRNIYVALNGLPVSSAVLINRMKDIYGSKSPVFYAILPCTNCIQSWTSLRQVLRVVATSNKQILFARNPYLFASYLNHYVALYRSRHVHVVYGKPAIRSNIKKLAEKVLHSSSNVHLHHGAWPWYATVSSVTTQSNQVNQLIHNVRGAGSLVNHAWILTSARIFNYIQRVDGWAHRFRVVLGASSLTLEALRTPTTARIFTASRIVVHPKFFVALQPYEHESTDYDVALIRLGSQLEISGSNLLLVTYNGWVDFTRYIRPVSLPCSNQSCIGELLISNNGGSPFEVEAQSAECLKEETWAESTQGSALYAEVGMGVDKSLDDKNQSSSSRSTFKQDLFTIKKNHVCSRANAYMTVSCNATFTERMFCGVTNSDCVGDIGSPLMREIFNPNLRESCWVQLGVSSWNYGCRNIYKDVQGKTQYYPNYYTDLFKVMGWIHSNIDMQQSVDGCILPTLTANQAYPTTTQHNFMPGDPVAFACSGGQQISQPSEIICEGNGIWSDPIPVCGGSVEGGCVSQFLPENVVQTPTGSSFSTGTVIKYSCNPGFKVQGHNHSICQPSGNWSNPVPTCSATHCKVKELPNGNILSNNTVSNGALIPLHHSVTLTCNNGYQLVGDDMLECLEEGTWSSNFPQCNVVECPNRLLTPQLTAVPDKSIWNFGDYVIYSCQHGYKLVGSSVVVCLDTGEWSSILPSCGKDISCPPLSPPLNGGITAPQAVWSNGDVAVFHCDDGFKIVGKSTTKCQSSGNWSEPVPTCSGCSYQLTAGHEEQTITSPGWPHGYPDSSNCVWKVTGQVGWSVKFNFKTLSTSLNDYVEVTSDGKAVGTYEGNNDNTVLVINGIDIKVHFYSDDNTQGIGFYANFSLACGFNATATTSHQTILSPGWPDVTTSGSNCTWFITGRSGWPLEIMFNEFQSSAAYLLVKGNNGKIIKTLQGNQAGAKVSSSESRLQLNLITSSTSEGARFQATYSLGCGFSTVATSSAKTLKSPGFPDNYPPSTDCWWYIDVTRGWNVTFTITSLDLGSSGDYIEFLSNDGVVATMKGNLRMSRTIYVFGPKVKVHFHSDGSKQGPGFSGTFVSSCGFSSIAAKFPQPIRSPGWPENYPPSITCLWVITGPPGWYVNFDYKNFSTANDVLRVRYGRYSNVFTQLQGNLGTNSFYVDSDLVKLEFKTTPTSHGGGFFGTFYLVCGYRSEAKTTTQTIRSPGYPDNYPPSTECKWHIKGSPGWNVTFTFTTFHTQDENDYLEIISDGLLVQRLSGLVGASTYMISGLDITLKFSSNNLTSATGFIGTFKLTCGFSAVASNHPQIVTSPGWPGNYPGSVTCQWVIQGQTGWNIDFNFTKFSTSDEKLTVRYGRSSNVLTQLQGNLGTKSFYVNSDLVKLEFKTTPTSHGGGFIGAFYLACGYRSEAKTTTQTIRSPDYPDNYPPSTECNWYIRGVPGWNVSFTFTTFHTQDENDYLEIISDGSLVERLSGSVGPSSYMISGLDITLKFSSNNLTSATGFIGTFKLTCGFATTATFTPQIITSPSWPRNYASDVTCQWLVTGVSGWYIGFNFTQFHTVDEGLVVRYSRYNTYYNEFQGNIGSKTFYIDSNIAKLDFKATSESQGGGFIGSYFITCGMDATATTSNQAIHSPAWPDNYPPSTDCLWNIVGTDGWNVTFAFTKFNLVSPGDYLKLEGANNSSVILSGNLDNHQVSLEGSVFLVKFHSNEQNQGTGFVGNFYLSCGFQATATTTPQLITSPGWPGRYHGDVKCRWDIVGKQGWYIQFNFTHFDVADDTLTIAYVVSLKGHQDRPIYYTDRTNTYLTFNPNSVSNGIGFAATFALVCGRNMTASTSTITIRSPNYPSPYPTDTNCLWNIKGRVGYKILFTFSKFSTETTEDYLKFQVNSSVVTTLTGRKTGTQSVSVTGMDVRVTFHSNNKVTTDDEGFTGTFKLVKL